MSMIEEIKAALDPEKYRNDVKFTLAAEGLDTALEQQPSLSIYYGEISSKARYCMDQAKHQLEIVEALLYKEHRALLLEENPKVTEAQIKAEVTIDARHRAAVARVSDAILLHKIAESVMNGFDQRKDTLMQVARNMAREQNGAMRVSASQDARARLLEKMANNA